MGKLEQLIRDLQYARNIVSWRIVREVQEQLEEYINERRRTKLEQGSGCCAQEAAKNGSEDQP